MSHILVPYSVREDPEPIVVVWDLDETLVTIDGAGLVYRHDLLVLLLALKANPRIVNILWTRGNLPHLIDMIAGTLLTWCFDEYLWDIHSNECLVGQGKYKHPNYLKDLFPKGKFILIDDGEENCKEWPAFINITGLNGTAKATSSIEILARVEGLCSHAHSVRAS